MSHFPGVIALNDYLKLRDDIQAKMFAKGFGSITQENAEGLAQEFADGIVKITEATPGFDQYLSQLLGVRVGEDGILQGSDDLQKLQSATLVAWNGLDDELRPKVVEFDSKMERLASAPYDSDDNLERSARFLELAAEADATYASEPEVVQAWWDSQSPSAQREHQDRLLSKPPEFYTRWDWKVMGYDLDAAGADAWRGIAEQRMEIARLDLQAEIDQTEFSTGDAYAALNADIAAYMKTNPSFARTVTKANDWAFPFTEGPHPLVEMRGKAGQAWTQITEITRRYQEEINAGELFGPGGFGNTEAQTSWYRWQQADLRRYVTELREWSPAFDRSWLDVQSDLGGDPIIGSVILPDTYYGPLGAVGYGD
jgi:hypothetical protein